jgi:hypothetical protein
MSACREGDFSARRALMALIEDKKGIDYEK